jgi:threonine dehydratase
MAAAAALAPKLAGKRVVVVMSGGNLDSRVLARILAQS